PTRSWTEVVTDGGHSSALSDEGLPAGAPHPPQRSRVGQGVAVDEEEVGRAALGEGAGAGLAQQPSAVDGGRGQGVIRLQPGGDQRLDLPGELVGPQAAAAEGGPAQV